MHMALAHAYGISTCIWQHMHMALTHAYDNNMQCIWQYMHMATHAYIALRHAYIALRHT